MKFKISIALIVTFISAFNVQAQTALATGKQPQLAVDSNGIIRLVFGQKDKILFATSTDGGKTFSKPVVIGEVEKMHLGMTRGPQLASSRDYTIVTAMEQRGNINSFRLTHTNGKWERLSKVNDSDGSAPEGLMSVGADDKNNFYAVWLDLRENRKNNIAFASMNGNAKWSKNMFAYVSPEDHVCECCKPSVAVNATHIAIMFRNWLKGSRDLYLVTSTNSGLGFSQAQKLGEGTWRLQGCPMDGGGLVIDSENEIITAWQRDGRIYYAKPGEREQKIGEGRHVGMHGNLITWESGSDLMLKPINGNPRKIGEGTALTVVELRDKSVLAIWEKDDQIVFKKL